VEVDEGLVVLRIEKFGTRGLDKIINRGYYSTHKDTTILKRGTNGYTIGIQSKNGMDW
jgi:hypothetical protein